MSPDVSEAIRIVEVYLERSMAPDPAGATEYLAPNARIVFTGGREFSTATQTAAFNAKRYAWVKKRPMRTHAIPDKTTDAVHVYNTGHLYGAWPDGTPFDGNRYIDTFVVQGGKIIETHVWNDSAEILLNRAGLAEAPL